MDNANLDKKHAQILPKHGTYYLKDLNSSTGTWVKQGNDDPIRIEDKLHVKIGPDELLFSYGNSITDPLKEWLSKYNLEDFVGKIKDMGYKTVDDFQDFKLAQVASLSSDLEFTKLIAQSQGDIKVDLCEGHISKTLLIKNLTTGNESEFRWIGGNIANSQDAAMQISEGNSSNKQINREECYIVFQYGSYWLVNSKENPAKELYIKLKNGECQLRPADYIRLGDHVLSVNRFNFGNYEVVGTKQRSMEDKTTVIQDLAVSSILDFSFFGVFDGHGGMHCVRPVHELFPYFLKENIARTHQQNKEGDGIDNQQNFYSYIKTMIENAAFDTDNEVKEKLMDHCMNCGCTANIVMIIGNMVVCANIGDSRAILSRNKKPILLSKDHKPVFSILNFKD